MQIIDPKAFTRSDQERQQSQREMRRMFKKAIRIAVRRERWRRFKKWMRQVVER